MQVVAFHEQDLAFEFRRARDARDGADQMLSRLVGGMRLAREDEQHRTLRVAHDPVQRVEIAEQQRRALVGREAPPEADREHVRIVGIGETQQPVEVRLAALVAEMLLPDPVPHHVQQLRLEVLAHAPEEVVGNVAGSAPRCPDRPGGAASPIPRKRSKTSPHSGARNVGMCTPFVM